MSSSWVAKVVEAEAYRRAEMKIREQLVKGEIVAMVGLTVPQIIWLMADYEINNGGLARHLDPKADHVRRY